MERKPRKAPKVLFHPMFGPPEAIVTQKNKQSKGYPLAIRRKRKAAPGRLDRRHTHRTEKSSKWMS